MYGLIRAHQLNLMLLLCGFCLIIIFLLIFTRFMSKSRKIILFFMEFMAMTLLWCDRLAYLYAGIPGNKAYYTIRISNFVVFFLTSAIVLGFNLYVSDWMTHEGKLESVPLRLKIAQALAVFGMFMSVVSIFTGFYYYIDGSNRYHRGVGFLIAYIPPVVSPILQYTVVKQYKKIFSKLIYYSLFFYIFVPIACGIVQIFTYGISIVNISMVIVSIGLYIFTYLDINNTVERAHEIEIQNMQGIQTRVWQMFDRTMTAVVSEVEDREGLDKGNAVLSAEYSRKIAENCEKDSEYCDKAYYATLFNAIGMSGVVSKVIDLKPDEAEGIRKISEVACDYVRMTTDGEDRNAVPDYVAREKFVLEAGEKYDLAYANIMVRIIDAQIGDGRSDEDETETDLRCGDYRDHISRGIEITSKEKRIRFNCLSGKVSKDIQGAPSIVLFDSYDRRTHADERTIREYRYLEYGEVWFTGHYISTDAKRIEKVRIGHKDASGSGIIAGVRAAYEIRAVRYEDHMRIVMAGPDQETELIVALPDKTKAAYIGLTGEHCVISDIIIDASDKEVGADDIPRIVGATSYIDCLESDLKNVQIDRFRSAASEGVDLQGRVELLFHSMSLPSANMIWHCPSIVLYSASDGEVFGEGYREYDLIKLNGQEDGDKEYVTNRFKLKKKEEFPGWESWKETNKAGLDYEVSIERRGDRIVVKTENMGIDIENTTTLLDGADKVYAAITGDQVALTDIRVKRHGGKTE